GRMQFWKDRGGGMLTEEDMSVASQTVLLKALPEALRRDVLEHAAVRLLGRGETVFLQGEPAKHVYIVLSGWIKLFRIARNGAEAVVNVFTRQQSFAEAVALSAEPYRVNAEAVTCCRLMAIDAHRFTATMRAGPEVCLAVLAATLEHLHDLMRQVEQLKARTGAQRMGDFLLQHAGVTSGPCTVTLPYDKSLIAGRLGMKPESLSRAINRLREAGVSVRQNDAAIADVERLRAFVEQNRAELWQ